MDKAFESTCDNEKCRKEIAELRVESSSQELSDDSDFEYFHCRCHNISMGKTSFHCENCNHWACQSCCTSVTDDINVCTTCIKLPKYLYTRTKRFQRAKYGKAPKKAKKTFRRNLESSQETLPLEVSQETLPLEASQETLRLEASQKPLALEPLQETLPLEASQETLPLESETL
jgi:hypothetical protein